MRYYQMWIICASLLTLIPLTTLHGSGKEIDSGEASVSIRATPYTETFDSQTDHSASQKYHGASQNINWNSAEGQLTLQLDDHIAQQESRVVSDPTNNLIYVVWRDYQSDQGDIYAQKLNADGHRLWQDDVRVNSDSDTSVATQSAPAAAVDSVGNLWVVWVDDRNGHNDIYAQGINTEGSKIWSSGDQPVNQDATQENSINNAGPAVAIDRNNELIVAWHDNRNNGDFDIYAEKIDTQDNLSLNLYQWSHTDPIHTNRNGGQTDPSIAVDDQGNVVIAWLDQRVGNGDIYAQKLQPNGRPAWDQEKQLNNPQQHSSQRRPTVAMNNGGLPIVSWLSSTEIGSWIYINGIDGEGNRLGADIQLSQNMQANFSMPPAAILFDNQNLVVGWKHLTDGHLYVDIRNINSPNQSVHIEKIDLDGAEASNNQSQTLSLAPLSGNEIFAVWADSRQGRATDIYGQRLRGDGSPYLNEARLINASSGHIDQQNPALAIDSGGNSILTWYAEQGGESNLFLQKFNSSGQPQWSRQIQVSAYTIVGEALIPDIATIEDDIFVTWSDKRGGKSRVYVQQFDTVGNRVWDIDEPVSQTPFESAVEQFNPQIVTNDSDLFMVWQESVLDDSGASRSRLAFQQLDRGNEQQWTSDRFIDDSSERILRFPNLALVGEDKLVIAWTATQNFSTDLYFQLFSTNNGEPQGGPIMANNFEGLVDQFNPPALGTDDAGNVTLVWVDRRESGIYARSYLNGSDTLRWTTEVINQTPGTFSPAPDMAVMPDGDTVVVWQGIDRGEFRIYAQRLNAADKGKGKWAIGDQEDPINPNLNEESGVMVSAQSREPWQPTVAIDGAGYSVIAWREERKMNQDIYLHRLNENGEINENDEIGWINEGVAAVPADEFYHAQGFVESTTIDETDLLIDKALLTYQGVLNSGQITFSLTNNGETWYPVQPGVIHTFTITGSDLRWKADLSQPQVFNLNKSPIIESIQVDYTTNSTDSSSGQDSYEADDECENAWPIQADGITQTHMLQSSTPVSTTVNTDEDWISFQVDEAQRYRLLTIAEDNQTVQMELFDSCENRKLLEDIINNQGNPATYTPSLNVDDKYHVRISPASQTTAKIQYQFSVRPIRFSGYAAIIASQVEDDASYQQKIDDSAQLAEEKLSASGVISITIDQLREWPSEHYMDAETPLFIYLVGRVDDKSFYLDGDEILTAEQLDLWLSNLEMSRGANEIVVIIEADNAGQFSDVLAAPNRVLVTSTNQESAQTIPQGFFFSDIFWVRMGQGYSVQQSFEAGREMVQANDLCINREQTCQTPLLNDPGQFAQTRGLIVPSSFGGGSDPPASEKSPIPVIQAVYVERSQVEQKSTVKVHMLNGGQESSINAHLQLFRSGEVERVVLTKSEPADSFVSIYQGTLNKIPENGHYLVTIDGGENSDLTILPYTLILQDNIYLPYIQRTR